MLLVTQGGRVPPAGHAAAGGAEIAFQRYVGSDRVPHIYVMTSAGKATRRVTSGFGADAAWSADGRRIAFARMVETPAGLYSHIWTVRPDGGGLRRVTRGARVDWQPDFSPSGRRVVFEAWGRGGSAIASASARGGGRRLLTAYARLDRAPAVSPDGRIAFVRGLRNRTDVFVMDADGSRQRRVLRHAGADGDPAWSPDGEWIAFASNRGGRQFDVFVVRPDGSGLRRVTRRGGGLPTWSPDGRRIAFVNKRDGDLEIYVVDVDGTGERKLTDNRVDDLFPDWRP